MSKYQGIFEEIFYKNKPYPTNQQIYPLHQHQYTQALIQQVIRDINTTFKHYEEQGEFFKILQLTSDLRKLITDSGQYDLDLPLKVIHFRNDEQQLPSYPEFFLSNPLLITNSKNDHVHLFKALKYELQTADEAYSN